MIDTTKLEEHLRELAGTDEGNRLFNKWGTESYYEVLHNCFDDVEDRNLEIELHKGELVIDGHEIVRLEDVIDDDDDYYWVYNKWVGLKGYGEKDEGKYYASCVGRHTLIKGFISDAEYKRIVHLWNMNNFVKAI
jgi:hypothetical protein